MHKFTALLVISMIFCYHTANSLRYQDDGSVDSQYVPTTQELVSWILEMAQRNEHAHKRNSEIINNLLGFPKKINDAGRK